MPESDIELLTLTQDWFSVCEFNQLERTAILGNDPDSVLDNIDKFNTIGMYLVDLVGVYPTELKDWFLSDMKALGDYRPIDIISKEKDGFDQVFDEAQRWFDDIYDLEALGIASEGVMGYEESSGESVWSPNAKTKQAVEVAIKSYDRVLEKFSMDTGQPNLRYTLVSKDDSVFIRFQRGDNGLEGYTIEMPEGDHRTSRMLMLFIKEKSDQPRQLINIGLSIKTNTAKGISFDEQDIPHDQAPPPSGFAILQFARKIERLFENDQLELVK